MWPPILLLVQQLQHWTPDAMQTQVMVPLMTAAAREPAIGPILFAFFVFFIARVFVFALKLQFVFPIISQSNQKQNSIVCFATPA